MNTSTSRLISASIASCLAVAFAAQAFAGTVYWDLDPANGGGSTSTTATGTWDQNTTTNWNADSGGIAGATGTYQAKGGATPDAVFSAGTDVTGQSTVTISGGVSANSILVEDGNIVFAGASTPVLTLGGATGAGVTIAATASIAANTSFGATVTSIVLNGAQSWDVIDSGRTLSTNALTVITGAGPLTINGASNALGKVVLANNTSASNFTGGVTVKGGTLAIDSLIGAGQISSAGVGSITLGDTTGSRDVLLMNNTNTAKTFNNAIIIASGSTGAITIQGGVGTPTNTTTWAGGITMNRGVTLLATGNASGSNTFSTNAIVTNGNTITAKTISAGRLNISAPITGNGGMTVDSAGGTGWVLLTGASTGWTGAISVINGILGAGDTTTGANALGSGPISLASGTTLTFNGASANGTYYQNGAVTIASGSATINSPGSSGRVRAVGSFDLGIGGVGSTALFDPVIQTVASSGLRLLGNSIIDVSPTGAGNGLVNIYGGISDSGGNFSFTKTGVGILTLGGTMTATVDVPTLTGLASTYHGDTNIAAGTLRAGSLNALPTGTKVSIATGAVFSFAHAPANSGTNSDQEIAGLSNYSGNGGTVTANDTIYVLSTQRTLTLSSAGNYAFSGSLVDKTGTGNGVLGLAKTGSGTQVLSGTNTYTGKTAINGGTLQFGKTASLYNGTTASWTAANITAASGATLALNVGGSGEFTTSDVATISALGTATTGLLNGATLALDTSSGDFSHGTAIANTNSGANSIGLRKLGANSLTLTAANTYTGVTTISAGTLVLASTGSIASSSAVDLGTSGTLNVSAVSGGFSLASGQTLKGSGTVTGAITLASGSTLAIGNSPGTVAFDNNLTLSSGTNSNFEINGFTTGFYDLAQGGAGSQTATFGGTLNLVFQGGFNTTGTVKIFDFETYANAFTTVNTSGLASGYSATFHSLTGVVSVVPEPATWALLAFSLTTVMVLRRRRRE